MADFTGGEVRLFYFFRPFPLYLKTLPTRGAWGNEFRIFCGESCNSQYGIRGCHEDCFLAVSLGQGGVSEGWTLDPNDADAGLFHHAKLEDLNGTWRCSTRC